jgi:rhodanese-related sulfurtransferase
VSALRERGFDAAVLEGGVDAWRDEDFKLQPSDDPEVSPD